MTLNQALISATTLSTSSASVTIPVPSGYTDLRVVFSARNDTSPSIWYEHVRLTFNGGGGNYYSKMIYGNGSGAYGADDSGGGSTYAPWAGVFAAGNSTANTFSNCEIYVPNYGVSGVEKTFSGYSVSEGNIGGGATAVTSQSMKWTGTAAITSITLTAAVGNFVAGSSFTLYGISKLGVTPTVFPKATGGDIIKNDGTYWYHAFLSTGAFIPSQALTADVLVVAGGGGAGGFAAAGAGGAGGLLGFTNQALTSNSSYTCTIGAGGAVGANTWYSLGSQGGNSQFASLTAAIGGGGGRSYNAADNPGAYVGGNGGSGGGGGANNGAPGSGTAGQGNAGGYAQGDYNHGGGGGGAGSAGNSNHAGAGLGTYSSWGIATSTGVNVSGTRYFAGGGNALDGSTTNGATAPGTTGAANTGQGGGSTYGGASGGSGIVIVRYAMA